jgi:L-threonylcarbamoyladenylate synthase
MAIIDANIERAVTLLNGNELVGIPTETVYGLAGNALKENTVLKIFEVKNRPKFDPLIIHVDSLEKAKDFAHIPEELLPLCVRFWPGSLTILAPKKAMIPHIVTSGLENVAVRVPRHTLTLDLLSRLDFPLAAPSANPFGYISPTKAKHVEAQLGGKIPMVLDGGACEIGLESTIVGLEEKGVLRIYRKGGLEIEAIEEVFNGEIVINDHSDSDPLSPGMLKKHYSPNKQVLFSENVLVKNPAILSKAAFLKFNQFDSNINKDFQFVLSLKSDLREASHRLFEGLRYLDSLDIDYIFLERVPNHGLGLAINDRLSRAAAE